MNKKLHILIDFMREHLSAKFYGILITFGINSSQLFSIKTSLVAKPYLAFNYTYRNPLYWDHALKPKLLENRCTIKHAFNHIFIWI